MHAAESDGDAITGINVTPLVDVILVLLIIFMATAPLLQRRALHVNIPKAARGERVATETLRVELTARHEIIMDGRRLEPADFERELRRIILREPATHVAVAAEESLPYGEVVGLLDEVKGAGVRRIGLEVGNRRSRVGSKPGMSLPARAVR